MSAFKSVVAVLATLTITGCSLTESHVKQMDVLNSLAVTAQQSLKEGALTSVHASGQAINPGVTVEAAIVYKAEAKYTGLAGQFSIAQQGTSGPISPEVQEAILKVMRDKSIEDEQKRAIVAGLLTAVEAKYLTITSQPAE